MPLYNAIYIFRYVMIVLSFYDLFAFFIEQTANYVSVVLESMCLIDSCEKSTDQKLETCFIPNISQVKKFFECSCPKMVDL